MRFSDLTVGQLFRFADTPNGFVWEYRGNGWFGWPESGGPYHIFGNPYVIIEIGCALGA